MLENVRYVGGCYEVYIRCYDVLYRLVFFEDSTGDVDLWKRLKGLKGKVVGILKTDLREMPLRVRRISLKITSCNPNRKKLRLIVAIGIST